MTERLIIVDTETTGLDLMRHRPVEVAWLNWRVRNHAHDGGVFIPPHNLTNADDKALQINRYAERIAFSDQRRWDLDYSATRELHKLLTGATLAGANVRFDAAMLSHLFRAAHLFPEPWHYRLLDIEAFAAGVLGMLPWEVPSLRTLCDRLGVHPRPDHTAWSDVVAGAAVLDKLVPAGVRPCMA